MHTGKEDAYAQDAAAAMKFAVGGQQIWTVEGSDVFATRVGSRQSALVTQVKGIQQIASQQNEAVIVTMEDDTPVLTMMSTAGSVFYREKLPKGMTVHKIVSADDTATLYILGSINGSRTKVYCFNPYMPQRLDDLTVLGWDGQGIANLAR